MSPRFISLDDDSLVSLDIVGRVVEAGIGGEVYDKDGKRLGRTYDCIEHLTAIYVPAASDAQAVVFYADDQAPGGVFVERYPVVAWRIGHNGIADPVLFEDLASNGLLMLPMPDGTLCEQDSRTYENLDAAKAAALRSLKERDEIASKRRAANTPTA